MRRLRSRQVVVPESLNTSRKFRNSAICRRRFQTVVATTAVVPAGSMGQWVGSATSRCLVKRLSDSSSEASNRTRDQSVCFDAVTSGDSCR
jgi:hypothetical protein